mmetsp:Transcript_5629/g.13126  ORF Transcript_5629/g.13126 Transcript_5629/m.13126 type:complete len:116 (+) Transcript_5629:371-718(+)
MSRSETPRVPPLRFDFDSARKMRTGATPRVRNTTDGIHLSPDEFLSAKKNSNVPVRALHCAYRKNGGRAAASRRQTACRDVKQRNCSHGEDRMGHQLSASARATGDAHARVAAKA